MSPGEYYQLFGGPVATCRTFHLCQLAKWISVWVVHGDLSPSTVALIYVCFPAMLFLHLLAAWQSVSCVLTSVFVAALNTRAGSGQASQ